MCTWKARLILSEVEGSGPSLGCVPILSQSTISLPLLLEREQAGVAARGGGVDRDGALDGEAVEIMRAAGLGPGARQALAAEGLHADDGTDHIPVDVEVADPHPALDRAHRLVDAAVDAEGEAIAGRRDLVEHLVELVAAPADDVEDGAEDFALQPVEAIDLDRKSVV